MELYTLDSLFRRAAVVDQFESMIWTERYSAWGDFELQVISTPELRRLLPAGTRFAMSESYRVMTIELVENTVDSDGRAMIKLSGRSLEAILDDRVARNTFANLQTTPKWAISGKPGDIARYVFNQICRTNANFPDDQIPFLQPGTLFPAGNIAEPDQSIDVELALTTVYKAVKEICDAYELGFRLVRNFDTSQLYFDIYSGNNRTTLQSALPAVVFAPNLDNLTNISSITSISNYKNVAYVFHPNGVQIVTSDGVSVEVEGFERRVLTVDASDIDVAAFTYVLPQAQIDAINAAVTAATIEEHDNALNRFLQKNWLTPAELTIVEFYGGSSSPLSAAQRVQINGAISTYNVAVAAATVTLNASLQQRGRDELAKNRQISAFDGELPMNSPYPYELAYQLGDLVEMRNIDGVTNQMRVTEQIFVSDREGERAYPTLTMNLFISPDSWFGWSYNDVWATADGVWADK